MQEQDLLHFKAVEQFQKTHGAAILTILVWKPGIILGKILERRLKAPSWIFLLFLCPAHSRGQLGFHCLEIQHTDFWNNFLSLTCPEIDGRSQEFLLHRVFQRLDFFLFVALQPTRSVLLLWVQLAVVMLLLVMRVQEQSGAFEGSDWEFACITNTCVSLGEMKPLFSCSLLTEGEAGV